MKYREWRKNSALGKVDATLLLKKATGLDWAGLVARDEEEIPDDVMAKLDGYLARREAGEPINHITGTREFWAREFKVTPDVLIPRPDTEILVDFAITRAKELISKAGEDSERGPVRILDLGTGSGIVAISVDLDLAQEFPRDAFELWAVDVSPQALAVAKENAAKLGSQVKFLQGDWFSPFDSDEFEDFAFDMVVGNPPYIHPRDPHLSQGDLTREPQIALTDFRDGLAHYESIIPEAAMRMVDGGVLALEHGYDQGRDVRLMFTAAGFDDVATLKDLGSNERMTWGVRKGLFPF